MRIDLSEIVHHPGMRADQDFEEPCPGDLGLNCTAPVKGRLEFNNTGNLLLITGDISTEVTLECSRCLEDFSLPVDGKVEEEFRVEKVGDSVKALPSEEEDISPDLIVNNMLDVDELIRQSLLLVLPIQPLCRPDCGGICPTCGQNLNMRKCVCPPAEPESPFSALAELLEEDENEES